MTVTMTPIRLQSPRLELVEVTPQLAQADLDDVPQLGRLLNARIPEGWPPEHWEPQAIRWLMEKARAHPDDRGWFAWYVVLQGDAAPDQHRTLVGTCGLRGRADAAGVIEIGYGIVAEHQRRGYATEACRAVMAWALRDSEVRIIVAETYPHLLASLGVMRKLGMTSLGPGNEPNVVRYGVSRARFLRRTDQA
jgi:RimJ/RimL family protein N-acetyltransferase